MKTLRETLEGMAQLETRDKTLPLHPWWASAAAALAVLDSDNEEAIEMMEETYAKHRGNGGSK